MAAAVRRHWVELLMGVAVVVLSVWLGVNHWQPARAQSAAVAEPPVDALDAVAYAQIAQLRRELCLEGADLAAAGCDQAAAQRVLGALREWHRASRPQVQASEDAQQAAQGQWAQAIRQMNIGPADAALIGQVPRLQENLQAAAQGRQALMESAQQQVEAAFAGDSRLMWNLIRQNRRLPLRYRCVAGLGAPQVQALTSEVLKRGTAAASEARVLDADQRAAVEAAAQRMNQNLAGVQAAERRVLPPPPAIPMPAVTPRPAGR